MTGVNVASDPQSEPEHLHCFPLRSFKNFLLVSVFIIDFSDVCTETFWFEVVFVPGLLKHTWGDTRVQRGRGSLT